MGGWWWWWWWWGTFNRFFGAGRPCSDDCFGEGRGGGARLRRGPIDAATAVVQKGKEKEKEQEEEQEEEEEEEEEEQEEEQEKEEEEKEKEKIARGSNPAKCVSAGDKAPHARRRRLPWGGGRGVGGGGCA